MFSHEEDGIDVEGLRQQFEAERAAGRLGYFSLAELEHLLEWYLFHRLYPQAYEVIQHAASLYQDAPEVPFWRSRVAFERERYAEAYLHAMAALEKILLTAEVYNHFIEVCMAAERVDSALYVFDLWWEEAPTPAEKARAAAFLAEELLVRKQAEEAIPILWQGWAVYPARRLYFAAQLAKAYQQSQRESEGLQAFFARLWDHPSDVSLWLGLARLYLVKGSYAQGVQALEQARLLLEATENDSDTAWGTLYRLWAQYYEAIGQPFQAYRAWLQAREHLPYHPQVLGRLVAYYQENGLWEAAEPYLQRLHQKAPHWAQTRWHLARHLHHTGQYKDASSYYQTLLHHPQYGPEATYHLLRLYLETHRVDRLKKLLDKLLSRYGKTPTPWLYWVKRAYQEKLEGLAYLLLESLLRKKKKLDTASLYYWHAALALSRGQVEGAAHSLEQALLLAPAEATLFTELTQKLGSLPLPISWLLRQYGLR